MYDESKFPKLLPDQQLTITRYAVRGNSRRGITPQTLQTYQLAILNLLSILANLPIHFYPIENPFGKMAPFLMTTIPSLTV